MKRIVAKRMVLSVNRPHLAARWRRMLMTGRAYLLLSFLSMAVFVLLGLGGMLNNQLSASPSQSMKGFAASVSEGFFQSMLGMELPNMEPQQEAPALKPGKLASFLLRFLTDINPNDPRSLLALEMPGMNRDDSVLLRPGSGGDDGSGPVDYGPPEDGHGPEDERGGNADNGEAGDPPEASEPSAEPSAEPSDRPEDEPAPPTGSPEPDPVAAGRKVVFIYHSHNRESFYPELKKGVKVPDSGTKNITLVGKRMAKALEERGVGSLHSAKDYASAEKGYNYIHSYKYSLKTVEQAMSANGDLQYFFDIHRDSQRRDKTTVTIDGKDYAQVYFIIGHRNPDWKENEKFAADIHEKLERKYPGLSRGIWGKSAANGNGEYNQSVSPDSVLVEIGGVDNTLEECYRTAEALAEAVAELIWDRSGAVEASADGSGAE